jgi:transposase-like protein
VDETYIKVKGQWKYLYRAVDSEGNTLDFMLSAKRNAKAAEQFFCKTLDAAHTQLPRAINVDKNAAYPPAIGALKVDEYLPETTQPLRPSPGRRIHLRRQAVLKLLDFKASG